MTVDNCVVFDLADIENIQFECGSCHARHVAPIADWKALAYSCANCGAAYFSSGGLECEAVNKLRVATRELLADNPDRRYKIRFELKTSDVGRASRAKI